MYGVPRYFKSFISTSAIVKINLLFFELDYY